MSGWVESSQELFLETSKERVLQELDRELETTLELSLAGSSQETFAETSFEQLSDLLLALSMG